MFSQFFCGNIKIIFNSLIYFFIESIFLSNTLSAILSIMVSDTPHYENEPFEVPKGWEWQKLGDIGVWQSGATPSRLNKEYYGGNIPWLKTGDLNDGYIQEIPETITQKALEETSVKLNPAGSVLIAMYGATIGKVGILTFPATTNQACCACVEYNGIEQMYLFYFLLSHKEEFIMLGGGGAQPNISKEKIVDTYIPIPPQFEQKRIINAIEQWFALIDTLENAKEDLQTSITQAKSKILDLAIHGKLVPQDPSDEPAIELLKRINSKFVPCDNAHYENLPSNWTAILLGDLCFTINGLWKGKKPPFVHVGVIRNANFTKDCKLDYSNIAYLEVEVKQYEKRKLQYGDIIVEKSGGSDNQPVGRTILFEKTEGDYSFSNFTSILRIYDGYPALPEYLNMYLQVVYQTGITKRMQTQTTGIHNLIFDQFLAIPIKLPPLAEQRRIINKVSKLSQILDNISAEL